MRQVDLPAFTEQVAQGSCTTARVAPLSGMISGAWERREFG